MPPETDSDEATDFVDETLTTYNLETIENMDLPRFMMDF